jgi:hypothetical protein
MFFSQWLQFNIIILCEGEGFSQGPRYVWGHMNEENVGLSFAT